MQFKSIFLIDDDEDDRDFFLEVIGNIYPSASCEIARNGREGLDHLDGAAKLPDIIFLDLNMPLMNGKQFLANIKQDSRLQHIPVVILSTSSDSQTISELLSMGAVHFITKPDKFSAWQTKLNEFLTSPRIKYSQ
jgi:CheY-like chemotaxis protein